MPQSSLRSISNDYARLNGSDYGHRTGSETEGGSGAARPCKDKAALNLVQPGSVHRDYRAVLARLPRRPSQDRWHSMARRTFRAGMKLIARNHGPIMSQAARECERLRSRGLNEESAAARGKKSRFTSFVSRRCWRMRKILCANAKLFDYIKLLTFLEDNFHSHFYKIVNAKLYISFPYIILIIYYNIFIYVDFYTEHDICVLFKNTISAKNFYSFPMKDICRDKNIFTQSILKTFQSSA